VVLLTKPLKENNQNMHKTARFRNLYGRRIVAIEGTTVNRGIVDEAVERKQSKYAQDR